MKSWAQIEADVWRIKTSEFQALLSSRNAIYSHIPFRN